MESIKPPSATKQMFTCFHENKISFGRVSALIVIISGLLIAGTGIVLPYMYPDLEFKVVEKPDGTYAESVVISQKYDPDWGAISGFLGIGIAPLATLLFAGSKALGLMSKNGNSNPPTK